MKKYLLLIALIVLFSSCTDPKGARKALEDSGYTPIEVGGFGFQQFIFAGEHAPIFNTKFKAYAPNSKDRIVTGVVTEGFFVAKTIRLD